MAEDHSSTCDPAVTERPSPAARLIILVGPDPPGDREAGSGPPGGRTGGPARKAPEPLEDADGLKTRSQEGNRRDQLNR
jgi:hypothetical protein